GPIPIASAWTKTVSSGSTRNTESTRSVKPISRLRTVRDSVTGDSTRRWWIGARRAASGIAEPLVAPGLDQIDEQQDRERHREHLGSDGSGGRVVAFLEAEDDEQRQDFRLPRNVAGNEDHRSVLADGAGER